MATATLSEIEIEIELPIIEMEEHFEVVNGHIVEEPPLGAHEGGMASFLDQTMGYFARMNRLGRVVTEVLFALESDQSLRRRPDVAFVSKERWPINRTIPRAAAWDVIPDLAVEFTSPTDLIDDLMDKIGEYFEAEVRLVWVVYPKHRKIYVYDSPTSVRILQVGDELDGGPVLPEFRLPLAELFEMQEDGPQPAA